MSAVGRSKRLTPLAFRAKGLRAREGGEHPPLVMLTAYTAGMAAALDPHCDALLVGDSLGMVIYGEDTTVGVSLDTMIAHGRAVVRGSSAALVVVDLPFGAYEASPEQAFRAAARALAETGCGAVKLEGGEAMAETVAFLTRRGVPVMGHVGLTPQAVNQLGGFVVQGRDEAGAARVTADALAVERAGAFAVVLEGVVEPLGRAVTARAGIPVIGIGASAACDGQVLVVDDLLGTYPAFTPRFAKRYAELGRAAGEAAAAYAADVRARRFPGPEHVFQPKPAAAPTLTAAPKAAE